MNSGSTTRIWACVLAAISWSATAGVGQTAAPTKLRPPRFVTSRTSSASSPASSLDEARRQHAALASQPRSSVLAAAWTTVGPAQVKSDAFGNITGRITTIAVDPADPTGNTVYLGTTGGGIWRSTNAAGPSTAVSFLPLTDTMTIFDAASQTIPSLSIGSMAIANGVILAGTGDPNDATDSYYGAGILRSVDGGVTWTIAQQSHDGAAGNHLFFGLSTAGIAFSSANPALAVAAMSQATEGTIVNAATVTNTRMGLYYTIDAGLTWQMATILDGSQPVQSPNTVGTGAGNAVTSVVWNPLRNAFFAAVRYHGYYTSTDGATWTRLAVQPSAGLTTLACPANPGGSGSTTCPIFRGVLAVQPTTGDTFALSVDTSNSNQGLYQDVCASSGTTCSTPSATFGKQISTTPLQFSNTLTVPQADYNLAMSAASSGADTILYVGTTDLYRCTLGTGCVFRNTTNAANGCTNPAGVAPYQHAIAVVPTSAGPLVYLGGDGGLWRSTDGVAELAPPCSLDDANHFQNLNGGLGSLAEIVSIAQSPADPAILLAGMGVIGTAGTSSPASPWTQLATGEGGTVAIDPANPNLRYLSNGAGINIASCTKGAACTALDFTTPVIGAAQTSYDSGAVDAPWLLDPGLSNNVIAGTCRIWRGPTLGGGLWSAANALSRPFSTPAASTCGSNPAVVRSLAAGGAAVTSSAAQNSGSQVIYAGLAGVLDGGAGLAGHVFVTSSASQASNTTAWADVATSPVTNDATDQFVFNPGGFDVSSLAADPHDATGATVYATIMGFAANHIAAPHVYRSTDTGGHWTNISANLPNAPANAVVVDPNDANTIYVALDTGVYVTTQVSTCASSNCWSVYGTALPNSPVTTLLAAAAMPTGDGRNGELRAGTYGRGIWQIPLLTASSPATPQISINPSAVAYPAQQVGTQSAVASVTITNTGNAPLNITSITLTGDFSETDSCSSGPVVQSGTCIVQIRFLPTAIGSRAGLLTVYGNFPGGQATASLSGIGTAPATVVLSPASLVFPATNVGASSATQSITISNAGTTPTTLQPPVVTGDFAISANTCGASLGPSSGCTVTVNFTPTAAGTRSGTISITGGAGTQVATLSGIATNPPTDALSPLGLTFGPQQLATASASQQVMLTNAGDAALTLISARITGGDFVVVNACGNSLAAHSTCALTVTYIPTILGPQAGSLAVSDQFRTQTVSLSGTGLAPPGVSLAPSNGMTFAATGVGLVAAPQTVTLTNNGGVILTITNLTVSGDYSIVPGSNTCGSTLGPAAICTLQIVFAPTAAGVRTGTVAFSDNATASPQTLALSGVGIDFALASNGPASATIAGGQSATYALLLSSAAGLPGTATFTCAGVPLHATCTVSPSTAALSGTTNISVTVATSVSGAMSSPPAFPWTRQLVWVALLLPAGLALGRRRLRLPALCLLALMAGCSTGRTIPATTAPGTTVVPTPAGTYTVVVAASNANLVRAVNLTLTVQ